jgi:hypothetical protein
MIKLCYYCSRTKQLLAHKTIQKSVAEREMSYINGSDFYIRLESVDG